ncbi:hydroxyethylthiazole kinase [Cryobacterium sp. Hz9]|uniref:hydroxyethylthiazole kinase n=1 Tax=Cryobacterium sp. Hz9 TaxID=1259167 RepID=UPI00106CFC31|nr:hydroxyethylthiazole kinase [Cryobacterium sp. Hz9]TFB63979.1 hydroxyethylthiazole kinase [Cryobacterium sp. Hz9]
MRRFTADDACLLLARLRERTPLVQRLTNAVVTNFTANALLAIGAAPAMTDIPIEADQFAHIASATLVNLGTPHAEQRAGTPWVLDPVAVGVLSVRTQLAADLLAYAPTAVPGNASEVITLTGLGRGGRGVDSVDTAEQALDAAGQLADRFGCVVAISGATDSVTDGIDVIRLSNGHSYLTQVTGGGCALGAITAALLAVGDDRLVATAAATAVYTIAAERAAVGDGGPGSFAVAFLDALASVDTAAIRASIAIS